jgi:hypothetical protein
VVAELAPELVDEQAAVGEDQHAFGARASTKPAAATRPAGGGRVAESVAALRARILRRRERQVIVRELRHLEVLVLLVLLDELIDRDRAVSAAFPFSCFWLAAISSVSIPVSAST